MAKAENYDVVIVGSGPGGYVAAVKAAQLDMKVACIEKEPRLGGVCLNVGCIPSKALLDSSEYYQLAKDQFAAHGIKTGSVSLDLAAMMARKEKVVQELTDNVKRLLEGHKVDIIHGTARLAGPDRVEIDSNSAGKKKAAKLEVQAKSVILASGRPPEAAARLSPRLRARLPSPPSPIGGRPRWRPRGRGSRRCRRRPR